MSYSPEMREQLQQMLQTFRPDELDLFAAALDSRPGPARELVKAELRRRAALVPWYRRLWGRLKSKSAPAKVIPLYPQLTTTH